MTAIRAAPVTHLCLSLPVLRHILRHPDPFLDLPMPLSPAEPANVSVSTDGPVAATQQATSSRGGAARSLAPEPASSFAEPLLRACELLPTLADKDLVSHPISVVPDLPCKNLQAGKDNAKEAPKKAADQQQRTGSREREALITRDRRVRGPVVTVQKRHLLAGAARQRMRMGLKEFPVVRREVRRGNNKSGRVMSLDA